MKHLNRAMVMVEESILVYHIETKVVDVKLVFVTDRPQSMVARVGYMQYNKSTQLH